MTAWHADEPAEAAAWHADADPAAQEFVTQIWDALAAVSPSGIALAWMNAEGILKASIRGAVPPPAPSMPGPPTPPVASAEQPPDVLVQAALVWLHERGFLDRFELALADVLPRLWARAWADGTAQAQAVLAQAQPPKPAKGKKKRKKQARQHAKRQPPPGPPPSPPPPALTPQQLLSLLLATSAGFAAWLTSAMVAAEVALIVGSLARRVAQILATASVQGWGLDRLAEALERAFMTRWRAEMIAATEAARAQGAAMTDVYRRFGVRWVRWQTRNDNLVCPRCMANQKQGTIRLGKPFVSGAVAPPQHPRCRCWLRPSWKIMRLIGKNATAAHAVYAELEPDYPPESIEWVYDADWAGPQWTPAGMVNFTPDEWAAGHEDAKVDGFKQSIKEDMDAGRDPKPVILIDRPDTDRDTHLIVIDGHHHAMAYNELGLPVRSYVGRVDMDTARIAEKSHLYQYTTEHPGTTDAAASPKAGKLPKQAVHYKPAELPGRRCGTCIMYHGHNHSCDLVAGHIAAEDMCDRWEMRSIRKDSEPRAAGIMVQARDTGRVLMLQRRLDDDKHASGQWELPGGRLDDGETPREAAVREWCEETGCAFPDGEWAGEWDSDDGPYTGYVYVIDHENDLDIHGGRDEVPDPDHPDGPRESLAWFDLGQLKKNPAVREEIGDSYGDIRDAAAKSAETPVVSTVHHPLGHEGLWHTPSRKVPVMQQLPAYIQNTARALMRDHGMDESQAIATAINAIKRWAEGTAFGGRVKVTPQVQAAARRALQEWEDLKASHH